VNHARVRSHLSRLIGAAALALVVAACGGSSDGGSTDGGNTPGPAPDAGVQVVATGSWNDVGLGSKSWGWGVLLENPTGEAVRVDMTVNALNAAGEVVDTMSAMWTVVLAGSQGGMSGASFGVPETEKVASIDIEKIETSASDFAAAELPLSDVSADGTAVTGAVTNGSDAPVNGAWITALYVDGGSVVGGGGTMVDIPAPDAAADFTVNLTGAQTGELVTFASPPYL
jgi:hypothetical protein